MSTLATHHVSRKRRRKNSEPGDTQPGNTKRARIHAVPNTSNTLPKSNKPRMPEIMKADSLNWIQANVKQSERRLKDLLSHAVQRDRPWDIICVQDPPKYHAWVTSPQYRLWYHSDRTLTEDDGCRPQWGTTGSLHSAPSHKSPGRPLHAVRNTLGVKGTSPAPKKQPPPMALVCFFVHESIPLAAWQAHNHKDRNQNMVATLTLKTSCGTIKFHNVYNHELKLDIDAMAETCTSSAYDILLGDFNLHHELWGGPGVQNVTADANRLHRITQSAGMTCLNNPSEVTYQRSSDPSQYTSTIDLVFVGSALNTRVFSWRIAKEVAAFSTDHRVIECIMDIQVTRQVRIKELWKKVHKKTYRRDLEDTLCRIGFPVLDDTSSIDKYAEHLSSSVSAVVERCVPKAMSLAQPSKSEPHPDLQPHLDAVEEARKRLELDNNLTTRDQLDQCVSKLHKAQQLVRRKSYRKRIGTETKTSAGLFKFSKLAATWCAPRALPTMPEFVVNGKTYSSGKEKARCFADAIWPDLTVDAKAPSNCPPQEPSLPHHSSPQHLEVAEISLLLRSLPTGKAKGPDDIAYEAMKTGLGIIDEYLHHLFTACLKFAHHPEVFKKATTIALRKPDKKTYALPKSWRPIALLSCMGKVLEKIVAKRLKDLAFEFKMLPATQYGSSGKCTTKALEAILNPVYIGWSTNKQTTLMSLDITGAYDRVCRQKLLKIMREKSVSDWIVRFAWSFLSYRRTTINIPEHQSDDLFVNIGIPQGSPLSPLLFLFFASPIMDLFHAKYPRFNARAYCFAYVDDTYLLVTSGNYDTNCALLEKLHKMLITWATPNGVTFDPYKYNILHFKRPRDRATRCKNLPNIAGLNTVEEVLKTELRILGVIVDDELSWKAHIAHIETKVKRQLTHLRRISSSVSGPSLCHMRHLYVTKVRPVISYGCGAWFMTGSQDDGKLMRWSISTRLLERLRKLQYQCLQQISGARKRTSSQVLHKELQIEPIDIFLQRLALSHRARALETPAYKELHEAIIQAGSTEKDEKDLEDNHPYMILSAQAQLLRRESLEKADEDVLSDPKQRARAINNQAKLIAARECAKRWNMYRRENSAPNKTCPALLQDWRDETLIYYKSLSRVQSTMLLHCRSNAIGLKGHLYNEFKLGDSGLCPCNHRHEQTVKHLLLHCQKLDGPRSELRSILGHTDLDKMLTYDADIVTVWAIRHFDIDQFEWSKQHASFFFAKGRPHLLFEDT